MLAGTFSLGETCQPAWSSSSTACAPGATAVADLLQLGRHRLGGRSRAERDQPPCPWLGRSPRRGRPRPSVGRAALRAVCRGRAQRRVILFFCPIRASSCHHSSISVPSGSPARGSPPTRRAGFFKHLPSRTHSGRSGAGAPRAWQEPRAREAPADCRLVNCDPELLKEPARQVLGVASAPRHGWLGWDRSPPC